MGTSEASSAVAMADIRHINAIVAGDDGDEVEAVDPSAVRPAALEIGLSIDVIVERAGEGKSSARSRSIAERSLST